MPRTSVGTVAQPVSRTALAAHVASRLAGRLSDRERRDEWLKDQVGLKLRSNGVERAASRAQVGVSPFVLVDEPRLPLPLEKAYVHFPGAGERRPALIATLRALGVVRQLLVTRSRRDVVCILVYAKPERDAIFAALEAVNQPFIWDEILEEDRELERDAWVALSQRFAALENLLEE